MRKGSEFATSLCALAIGLSSQAAFAQESADERGLEEIIVTARRTSENLQSVPVSITTFSGADLQQQNARSVSDIAALTPGLQVNTSTTTPAGAIYTLRGQVQQDPIANQDAAVGVYVDGLYWARAYGANADLLDVSGIQVLKGPQGTLFGRNTTGGAVLLTTNDPSFQDGLSGQLSATYGRFNYRTISGVINAPLVTDKLAVRVAGQLIKRDGYIRDINNNVDLANLDSHSIRAKVLWQPTETLSIVGSGEWFRSNTLDNPQLLVYASPNSLVGLSTVAEVDGLASAGGIGCFNPGGMSAACQARAAALFADNIAKNKGDNADITTIPRSRITTQTYGLNATLDTSFGAIKAIGGFRNVKVNANSDNDGSRFRLLDNGQGFGIPGSYNSIADLSQYSIEVVATGKAFDNKLDFAAGLYYFHEYGSDASVSTAIVAINPFSSFFKGDIKNDSMSGFGQVTYHATEKLSFTGGLRYSIDDRRLTSYNGIFTLSPPPPSPVTCLVSTTGVCPAVRSGSFKGLSYTASIDYQLRDGLLVYVKTAKGFRSGGLNIRMLSADTFTPFAPEKAYSYEAGIKSEFLDRRLRVNLAGYYTQLKDQQRTTSIVANNTVSTAIQNAGQADVYGAELEVNAILPAGLRLDGTLGYTHPKYVSFPDVDNSGVPFERREEFYGVPEWTASISPSWTQDFAFGQFRIRADFSYQSDMNVSPVGFTTTAGGGAFDTQHNIPTSAADAAGFLNAATDKAHWLVNARASLTMMDGNLDLAVWGKNLTDKRDYVAGLSLPTFGFATAGTREPRTFGVTATVKFGAH